MTTAPVGTCCIVLHSHLPWLAHHGTWPVGEEWLYQSWAGSYLPVVDMLQRLGDEGRTDLLTLGVTPVLAAQLDDPYLRQQFQTWLADWQVRAQVTAERRSPVDLREVAWAEHTTATAARSSFESTWSGGGSVPLRRLSDSGTVEILGGPATHAFQPGLTEAWVAFGLRSGLDDAALRLGSRPHGVWLPECGYRPGLESLLRDAGAGHLVVEPTTVPAPGQPGGSAEAVFELADSGVVGLRNDRSITDLVWSATAGYPGGQWYRDFHFFDPTTGVRTARVTGPAVGLTDKAPYEPAAAASAASADAGSFVAAVRRRLVAGEPPMHGPRVVVAAFDTELFGHWWHEGPQFLEAVLRLLPEAGVRPATLRTVAGEAGPLARVHPRAGTWGQGRDNRSWTGPAVAEMAGDQARLQQEAFAAISRLAAPAGGRRPDLDQLARNVLLATASDWAFMVTHDTAAAYARDRYAGHRDAARSLLSAVGRADGSALPLATEQRRTDGPFGQLDARLLTGTWAGRDAP